jgi:5-methylcytosine-specific restriction endonuclease McrA
LVTTAEQLFENLSRYRKALESASGYTREELLRRIPMTRSWIAAFDEAGLRWHLAPSKFAGYVETTADSYLARFMTTNGGATEAAISNMVTLLDNNDRNCREATDALLEMAGSFAKPLRKTYRISVIRGYEPTASAGATPEAIARELGRGIRESASLSSASRKNRLARAEKRPKRILVRTYAYIRNPDVIAEALFLADGMCGGCRERAPFERLEDDSPYLEVHHLVPLSEGGEDTVENAIALCANCHRREHFGPARWPWDKTG